MWAIPPLYLLTGDIFLQGAYRGPGVITGEMHVPVPEMPVPVPLDWRWPPGRGPVGTLQVPCRPEPGGSKNSGHQALVSTGG